MSRAPSRIRLRAALPLALAGCLATAALGERRRDRQRDTRRSRVASATTVAWAVDGLAPPVSGPHPPFAGGDGPRLQARPARRRQALQRAAGEAQRVPQEEQDRHRDAHASSSTVPTGVNEVEFDIVLYHGKGTKVLAVTDFIGIRVIPGQLTDAGGVRLTFDPLPTPPEIPGVEITLRVQGRVGSLGAKRKVVKRVGPRRTRRTFRYSLVRTPEKCDGGSWAATATLGFPDGTSLPLPTPMACPR